MSFQVKLIVNHRTYLRGLTSKGTKACTKRFSEIISRVRIEIIILMDRLTNLNPKVGSEVPHPLLDVQGVRYCVVYFILSQSKQPTSSSRKNGENPKSINNCQKRMEFGISRNMKMWGRRRIHSTAFISGKESNRFAVEDVEFEGSIIKDQFKKLQSDLTQGNKANNLTSILSNKNFLISCYQNIKSNPGNMTKSLDKEDLDGIRFTWFEEVSNSFRKGSFNFKPSRRTYIQKLDGKLRPITIPSPRDKIVQEGMRILLDAVFEKNFRASSHAFRAQRGCHTALNQIKMKYGKVNWLIEGDVQQQYPSIDHNILVDLLREKIQDEPFIDLIYKYMRVGYGEKHTDKINPTKIGLAQGGLISPVLSNIYMHPFDVWVEDELIPKYTKGKRKRSNPEYTKMIRSYGKAKDKTIRSTLSHDLNFCRVHYTRYADDFLIGVQESKKTCELILREIKSFLEKRLALTLNVSKTKIIHSTSDRALFLGYHISCTPIKKMRIGYNSKNQLVRHTTRTVLNAPIKTVVEKLKEKGFLNSKKMPTRNGRYINIDLWNIVENHKVLEKGILNYYAMANNYGRLAARVHYSLKYSCALTISSKMKLKTMRGAFKKYGKNLTVTVNDRSISYPKIPYSRPKRVFSNYEADFDATLNRLVYRFKRHAGNLKGPCIICKCNTNIEVHHIRKLKDVTKKKDWLSVTMAKYSRKQVPVCRTCHQKIHLGVYDGSKL